MFFFNTVKWIFVTLCVVSTIVQGSITEDPTLAVKWPRGVGQHAIQVVGDASKIDIYATNYKTIQNPQGRVIGVSSTGKCKKLTNSEQKTFEAPCTFETNEHDQTFQAECVNGDGSASIYFPKQGSKGTEAVVSTDGDIWVGFSNKKNEPLKQGELLNDGDRESIILSCDGDSRGNL